MKEISEELANELYEMLSNAQLQSEKAYEAAKARDTTSAARHSASARAFSLRAIIHLERHVGHNLNYEPQAATSNG